VKKYKFHLVSASLGINDRMKTQAFSHLPAPTKIFSLVGAVKEDKWILPNSTRRVRIWLNPQSEEIQVEPCAGGPGLLSAAAGSRWLFPSSKSQPKFSV
jgi:hypothetical protein